jgi:hypothetical protein
MFINISKFTQKELEEMFPSSAIKKDKKDADFFEKAAELLISINEKLVSENMDLKNKLGFQKTYSDGLERILIKVDKNYKEMIEDIKKDVID